MRLSIYSVAPITFDTLNLVWVLGTADTTINDGTHYLCKNPHATLGADLSIVWTDKASGQYPNLSGVKLKGQLLAIVASINLAGVSTVGAGYSHLMATLCPTPRGTRVRVTCKDKDDSDRLWYVDGVFSPVTGSAHINTQWSFAVGSDCWYSVASQTESTVNVTASGQTWTVVPGNGNDEVYPIITFTPTSAKGSGQTLQVPITLYNPTTKASPNYPVNIATTTGADFWDSRPYVSTDTTVSNQINLGGGITAAATTIPIDTPVGDGGGGPGTGLGAGPGMLWVVDGANVEQIYYTSKTASSITVYDDGAGITGRGWGGTTAHTHGDNCVLQRSRIRADGNDLQVMVGRGNGNLVQVNRTVYNINTALTKIIIKINIAARTIGTLAAAISAGATSLTLTNPDKTFLPKNGLLLIESEKITYTNFTLSTGVAATLGRGAKGTTAASHAKGLVVRAIDEMWLYCGDPTAIATTFNSSSDSTPVVDWANASTSNNQWIYTAGAGGFADSRYSAGDQFIPVNSAGTTQNYTADGDLTNAAAVNPVTAPGVSLINRGDMAGWQALFPFGWTSAVFTAVKAQNLPANTAYFSAPDPGVNEKVAIPSAGSSWSNNSQTYTPASTRFSLRFYIQNNSTANFTKRAAVNIGGLTVVLNTETTNALAGRPYVSLGAFSAIEYHMQGVIQNTTTGDFVFLNWMMKVGYKLILDTMSRKISYYDNAGNYLADASGAISDYSPRAQWLRILALIALAALPSPVSTNTMKYIEAGVTGMSIIVNYQYRNTSNG